MVKGHLDQSRKNQRSTKAHTLLEASTPVLAILPAEPPAPLAILPADEANTTLVHAPVTTLDDFFPDSEPDNCITHHCFASVMTPSTTGQIHTDQTGQFVVPSSTGYNYLLILYDYDSNSILAEPMPRRTGLCILHAYKVVHARLVAAGLRPKLQRLDNEASAILKDFMAEEGIDYQLVPPGSHRRNAAERAIRTFKNHFIAGLASVDKDFPLHLWDQLVPQAEATLNMLRGSRINPKLSAYAQLNGHFDFNRTPMAPPGIRVLAHVKPAQRTTWSPHAEDGWYIGPAMDSYRCYNIWIWDSRATRICDTVSWFPTKITMPLASSTDLIMAGIKDIHHALLHPSPGSPLAPLTDSHTAALRQLTEVLTSIAAPTPVSTPLLAITETTGAPSLRVDLAPTGAPPLRVAPATPPVPIITTVNTQRHVNFAPLPSTTMLDTFITSTGIQGNRKRKDRRKQTPKPISASRTFHPNKSRRPINPTPRTNNIPTHQHGTRSKHALHHVAASARQLLVATAAPPNSTTYQYACLGSAVNPDTGKIAEFRELSQCSEGALWQASNAEEIGRLTQGFGTQKGTDTMFFIAYKDIPKGRKATYLRVVAAFRPEKANPRRIRWTVGGDRIDYPYDVSTKTADLTTAKLLFNSVLSTPNAKFLGLDIKDFYLGTHMTHYEYMRIPIAMLPQAIIDQYALTPLIHNGFVYVEVRKGMYGLPQAGKLANDQLVAALAPYGYHPVAITPGLWRHDTRDIVFSLVVDDFGVRYTLQADADHLITTLQTCGYQVSTDWEGSRYVGLTLDWDYTARTCDISMPGYIARALQRFQHPTPPVPEHSPHPWQRPTYGATTQYAPPPDTSASIAAPDKLRLQEVLGTLLYYARALDSTLLTAISELATEQSKGTMHTMEKVTQLLNYCATNPEAVVRFTASDMLLAIESDASFLSIPKARSRAAGFFFLTSKSVHSTTSSASNYKPNGAIHILCHVMKEVLSSAAESELGALFHNGKEACPLRTALSELGHPQPATVIITDNSTAVGIANDSVKQKRSKAMDMRFYWIRDRVRQGQFTIQWKKGEGNLADYFTKHHPASHHKAIRSTYLYAPTNPARNYFECLAEETLQAPVTEQALLCQHSVSSPESSGEGVLLSPGNPDLSAALSHAHPHSHALDPVDSVAHTCDIQTLYTNSDLRLPHNLT